MAISTRLGVGLKRSSRTEVRTLGLASNTSRRRGTMEAVASDLSGGGAAVGGEKKTMRLGKIIAKPSSGDFGGAIHEEFLLENWNHFLCHYEHHSLHLLPSFPQRLLLLFLFSFTRNSSIFPSGIELELETNSTMKALWFA
ncbi:hypothetical protein Droror1_Dr00025617 [Drosera rotundifolia]